MPSENNQKKTPSSDKDSLGSLNSELVTSALNDLNIARKSILLYPLEHDQVKQSISRASDKLKSIFAISPEFKIGVAADRLLLPGIKMDSANSCYKELANAFSQNGIAVLTFSKDLNADELQIFLSIMAQNQETIQTQGGILNSLRKRGVHHLHITLVDYEKFKVTDENEINRDRAGDNDSSHGEIWHDFVVQILDGSALPTQNRIPQHVAELLNNQPENIKNILSKFEKIVDSYIQTDRTAPSGPNEDESMSAINTLLEELNPHLRRQFLTSALNRCNQSQNMSQTKTFLSHLSNNIVVEMLHQINKSDERMSESLLRLVEKIYLTTSDKDERNSLTIPHKLSAIQKDRFQALFKEEETEKFVPGDYNNALKQLGSSLLSAHGLKETGSPLLKEINDLNQPQLDQHIIRALKGLMDHCKLADEYNNYAFKVMEMAKESLARKDFDTAYKAIKIFDDHKRSVKFAEIGLAAQAALNRFYDPKTMNTLIRILHQSDAKLPPAIVPILKAIGPKIIAPLVDMFMEGGYGEKQRAILTVLKDYKKESVAAAHTLVHRDDIEKTRKMIFLIRQLENRASSAYLRSLVGHFNTDISREALGALLYFNDHWGIFFLRDKLNSDDPDDIGQAIAISGDYRINAMVPDLIQLFKFNALRKIDIKRNKELVSALGKIGDAAAIPSLTRLAKNAWSIYRSNLRELKVLIFQTLKDYPVKDIGPLLEIGCQIKDSTIQKICNQLSYTK